MWIIRFAVLEGPITLIWTCSEISATEMRMVRQMSGSARKDRMRNKRKDVTRS